jgi:hypothetical protein
MERTTVYLDAALKRKLAETAKRRGITEAKLLREALSEYLKREERPRVEPVGKSTDGGVAGRVDEALEELGFGRK